jgi:hypothetical protein
MFDFLKRTISFIYRNMFNNTAYFLTYIYHYFDKEYTQHASFYSEEELIKQIKNGKSLIRIGDGEIRMMNYGNTGSYEPFNERLRDYLITSVTEYSSTSSYILGIPEEYLSMPNSELRKLDLLHCWLALKTSFALIFPKKEKYFDAHLFYRGDSFARVLEPLLRDKKILIVTRKFNIDLMKETDLVTRLDIDFIETHDFGTFAHFDEILAKILDKITGDPSQYRVILSTGPASKAFAYELSKKHIISYDLGKGIEAAGRPNEIEHLI